MICGIPWIGGVPDPEPVAAGPSGIRDLGSSIRLGGRGLPVLRVFKVLLPPRTRESHPRLILASRRCYPDSTDVRKTAARNR